MPSRRYSFGIPIFRPLMPAPQRSLEVRHRNIDGGRVLGIVTRHRAQKDRRVAHAARDGSRLIERGGESHHAPARAAAIGRLDASGSGEGGGLADRAASVGGRRAETEPRRDRRRRTSRRAAGNQRGIRAAPPPGGNHRTEMRGLVRRAHREFVEIELASITAPSRQRLAVTVDS